LLIPLKLSGHYMYHQVNIKKFYVLPTLCICVFCVDLRKKTAIISLYNINWLVCITKTECVYCAVRTGSLYIIIYIYITLLSPVVTICTTSLTLNNSPLCPHSVFMCFVWISELTAIISLYNI